MFIFIFSFRSTFSFKTSLILKSTSSKVSLNLTFLFTCFSCAIGTESGFCLFSIEKLTFVTADCFREAGVEVFI